MKIIVKQSDLDRFGFGGLDFQRLSPPNRKMVAARVMGALGFSREAFLLETNNPVAVNSIWYVRDVPGMPAMQAVQTNPRF